MTTQRQENETLQTRYGLVDRTTLERLRDHFVTADLLKAVDASDDLSETRRMRVRTLLLRLHGMAQAFVNSYGGGMTPPSAPIWDLAEDAADELRGGAADFMREAALLDRLAALRPRDVGDDDDDAPQPAPPPVVNEFTAGGSKACQPAVRHPHRAAPMRLCASSCSAVASVNVSARLV